MLIGVFVFVTTVLVAGFLLLPSRVRVTSSSHKCSIQIVVLGDIGRSPRMQYHALSVASHGGDVQLIGYSDSQCIDELNNLPNVTLRPLAATPKSLQTSDRTAFLLFAPVKVLLQIWTLFYALCYQTTPSKWMLVQNPPSIPTLLLCAVVCKLRGTKLVIDWHNFGFSILAMKLGQQHPLVRFSQTYEQFFASFAQYHFAVTNAMCDVLRAEYVSTATVMPLHDRPAPIFEPIDTHRREAFLTQCQSTAEHAESLLEGRMRLLVSSTSWTADEDFSVLLEALRKYSISATSDSPQLPELLVIITGKGPQKDHYLDQISALERRQELEMVNIRTDWLSFGDYASLLAAADLGISLHTSSSGVDLPMKVVDMFGAGLPVLGFSDFKAWPELVQEGFNGQGFTNSDEMFSKLRSLMDPANKTLAKLKAGAMKESERRWDSVWDPVAGKLFGLVQ